MNRTNNYANAGQTIAGEDRQVETQVVGDNFQGRRFAARRRLNFYDTPDQLPSIEQTQRINNAQPETILQRYNVISVINRVQDATMDEITTTVNAAEMHWLHPDF